MSAASLKLSTCAFVPCASITAFEITKPLISIRSVQLTDATQRSLNELSATNGLELVYCDYERTDRTEPSENINMEIRKAASRALKAILITRGTLEAESATRTRYDSFASEAWDYTSWQWQLGSLYFPQQPVSTTATSDKILAASYKHALIAYDKYKGNNQKCAALQLYKRGQASSTSRIAEDVAATDLEAGGKDSPYSNADLVSYPSIGELLTDNYDHGTFAIGNGCVAVTLERSDLFNLSGVPINNSRVLSIRATLATVVATGRKITSFLKYVRLARVFLNNVEVEQ